MDAKRIARAGLMVALLAASAQVMLPFGPVPFTLQTFVLAMIPAVLDRRTAVLTVVAYVLLGAVGLPVSPVSVGACGALAGPRVASCGDLSWHGGSRRSGQALPARIPAYPRALASAAVLLLVSYVCGTVQLMAFLSIDLWGALAIAVAPFIIPDAVKLVCGARVGVSVARVLS